MVLHFYTLGSQVDFGQWDDCRKGMDQAILLPLFCLVS